jgi:putative nucleotidyltransferase with HDIG domain
VPITTTVRPAPTSTKRYLPHAVLATVVVMVLPALAVSAIDTAGRPWLVLGTVLLAMAFSVTAASLGSAIWMRRPQSRDLVFGDLMLWGWLRRIRAERRLAHAWELLEDGTEDGRAGALGRERRYEVLQELSALLEARDAYTHGHTRRVTRHSERIAREMGLSPEDVAKVRLAAAVHDVGKLHTPREILNKPGRLTDEEFETVKRHPGDGAEMLAETEDPAITVMVRHHHERLDGTGYPDGLAGDEIPLGARIIAVADTFDAMTSSRPYRGACKHKKALDVLTQEAGSQLDPAAVAAFRRYYSGKRSVAWSAFLVTAPQRLGTWAGGLFQGAGVGATPLGQGVLAMGAAALSGAALGGHAASATGGVERAASRDGAEQVAIHHARAGRDRTSRSDGDERRSRSRSQRHNGLNRPAARRAPGQRARSHTPGGGGYDTAAPLSEGPAPGPGPMGDGPGAVPVGVGSRPESPSPQPPTPDPPEPKPPKPERPKPERPKPEAPKPERPKPERPKPERPKPEGPKPEAPKPKPPKPKPPPPEPPIVRVPPVRLPPVEVPPVEVPPVEVPPVEVPPVEAPGVGVPVPSPPQLP